MRNVVNFRCGKSIHSIIFVILSIAYKVILHVIAVVLALLTRKVKVAVLNDSRETVAIIYISSVVMLVIFLALAALRQSLTLINTVWIILIFIAAMIHLGLTFIPKVCVRTVPCISTQQYNAIYSRQCALHAFNNYQVKTKPCANFKPTLLMLPINLSNCANAC